MTGLQIGITTTLLNILHTGQSSNSTQELLGEIYKKIKLLKQMREEGAPNDVILRTVYAVVDLIMERQGAAQKVSCRKGCAFCCKMNVDVTPMEVDLIVEYVRQNQLPVNLDYLKLQTAIPKDQLAFAPDRSACVFLQRNNTCMIYPVRPLSCRKYAVVNPAVQCNLEKYPAAILSVIVDIDVEILVSALGNIQKEQVDGLHIWLLKKLNIPSSPQQKRLGQ